jgi:prepilin-type N-terminal cleavage/methylation domain-containing protein/prepilin-type processing-associated H-X9-DG protein
MSFKKGFTLIELLVVISIVALLMAMLMPALNKVKEQAQAAVCRSNLRHWGVTFKLYLADHDDKMPGGWLDVLYPYYKDLDLALCPSAKKVKSGWVTEADGDVTIQGGKFSAWGRKITDTEDQDRWLEMLGYFNPQAKSEAVRLGYNEVFGSYGMNGHVGGTGMAETDEDSDWLTADVKGAYRAPVLLDGAGGGVPLHWDDPPEYDGQFYFSSPMNIHEIRNFCVNRHNRGVNVLFLDFSTRKVGLKDLWDLEFKREHWFENPAGRPDFSDPVWPDWMQW